MSLHILYIEDDEIDLLAFKRLISGNPSISLSSCSTFKELKELNVSNFQIILSDSNLPDADYFKLKDFLPKGRTQFISGTVIDGEEVWQKPLSQEQFEGLLQRFCTVNLKYIKDLADGDADYEKDMIETALRVLPDRLLSIKEASDDYVLLAKAAHKTKSSYRVCGIDNKILSNLEEECKSSQPNKKKILELVADLKDQIKQAIDELKDLISKF